MSATVLRLLREGLHKQEPLYGVAMFCGEDEWHARKHGGAHRRV